MNELHHRAVVVECHNDLILIVNHERRLGRSGTLKSRWLPLLRKGGIDVQVIPVSVQFEHIANPVARTLELIEHLYREIDLCAGEAALCTTGREIDDAVASGKLAFVMAFEGAEAVQHNIESIETFFRLGLRMMCFTWFGRTQLADGSGENAAGSRLTGRGIEALREMERLGIVMDVSHLSSTGTEHVLELATRPVIASHSSVRALCDHHRNLSDDHIRGIAATRGVVGLNLFPGLIDSRAATLDHIVDHVEHIASIAGFDFVGFGPDFVKEFFQEVEPHMAGAVVEGLRVIDTIPGLEGPQDMPNLTEAMLSRGFSESDVRKVLGENFLRVFREVMGVPGA